MKSLSLLLATLGLAAFTIPPAPPTGFGPSPPAGGFGAAGVVPETPLMESELVFPLEHWHNHASMVVEAPNGDLLVDWFHGSGERTADDVVVRGARLSLGAALALASIVDIAAGLLLIVGMVFLEKRDIESC